MDLDAQQTVRRTAMLDAAQQNNGVAQATSGQLIYFLALSTLRNEIQAKHFVLTRNGIHPELHEIDTSMTKITCYVGILQKLPS